MVIKARYYTLLLITFISGSPTPNENKRINIPKVYNKSKKKPLVGEMFNSTRKILQDFYKPYNTDLANFLNDPKFKWKDKQYVQY